jgi:hypothetical protein
MATFLIAKKAEQRRDVLRQYLSKNKGRQFFSDELCLFLGYDRPSALWSDLSAMVDQGVVVRTPAVHVKHCKNPEGKPYVRKMKYQYSIKTP